MKSKAMEQVLDFLDQLVRLTDERLQHILEHPEMAGLQALIEETFAAQVS